MRAVGILIGFGLAYTIALAPSDVHAAARCFCRLQCYGTVLQSFQDPCGACYTQIGNKEIKSCKTYCEGRFDQLVTNGGLSTYLQSWQQYPQCSSTTAGGGQCSMTLNIRDAVGTSSYHPAKSKTYFANLGFSCPPQAPQLSFDKAKCGVSTGNTFPGLPDQYIQSNYFTHNGTFYSYAPPGGNSQKSCTGWH